MNRKKSTNLFFKPFLNLPILLLCLAIILIPMISNVNAAGELRVGWDSSDMMRSTRCTSDWQYGYQGCMYWQILYDSMWSYGPGPDYGIKLRAVSGYETEDRIKWRFKLREGMTFHDGKPVTAEDLAFTMQYMPGADPVWSTPGSRTKKDSITIIDDFTVEFELEQKLGNKFIPFGFFPLMSKDIWRRYKFNMTEFDNKASIASGPFKLTEFNKTFITFDKFQDHWDKNPRVDRIIFKAYGGSDAKSMALKRGEIDMLGYQGVTPLAMRSLEKDPEIEVIKSPGISMTSLTFNLHPDGPIKKLDFRKAIVHAIDTDKIIEMIYHGFAQPHNSFIYPELPEYNQNLPKYEYSTETSNKILNDLGYIDKDSDGFRNDPETGNNVRIKFLVSTDSPENVKIASLFREQMKDIGLEVSIKALDLDTYYDIYYYPQGNGFDIAVGFNEAGPDSDWIWEFMRSVEGGGAGWNTADYKNPEFDKLINALYSESDSEKRKTLSFRMQEIMMEDLPHYVLCRPDILHPVRIDKLQGYESKYMGGIASWINPFTYLNVHAKE